MSSAVRRIVAIVYLLIDGYVYGMVWYGMVDDRVYPHGNGGGGKRGGSLVINVRQG